MNTDRHEDDATLADARLITTSRRRLMVGALLASAAALVGGEPVPKIGAQAAPTMSPPLPLADAVISLSPKAVWQHFYELTQIPRPSRHEEKVSAFMAEFGRGYDLETVVDEAGNVLIRKPGSPGMQERQGVVFQAHMDMVPVKSDDSDHDFETDPINAYVEDGWVRAEGTTLGGDNGIGVAMIMALLEDDSLTHGPLEALFTVNEEDGFTGANAVKPGVLRGALLFNIDSEQEGSFTIGCAGGVDVDAAMAYAEQAAAVGAVGVRLDVSGLQGGHSGIDIHRGRGNAIKLLARMLNAGSDEFDLRLVSMTGGDRYNAIPRSASAAVAVPKADVASLGTWVAAFTETVRSELAATEPDLVIAMSDLGLPSNVMDADVQRRIVDALNACPNGVMRMSDAVPGLVETSTNLGTVAVGDGLMQAGFLVRSSVDSERDDVQAMIQSVFALAGAETSIHDAYSGWQPNPDSPLLQLMFKTYQDLFGTEAGVMAVHAGLETSVIGEKYPQMDMISLGPTLQNVHSPAEQVEVATVEKVWRLLVAALERVPAA